MKDFSRRADKSKRPLDLNRAIETIATVARSEWRHVADLELELCPDLPPVPCFSDEIQQVILNLIVNASHAIESANENRVDQVGKIVISTSCCDDMVVMSISDTGTEIEEAVREQMFEPFFTTKELGKGTGQGLAITHDSIVNRHDG